MKILRSITILIAAAATAAAQQGEPLVPAAGDSRPTPTPASNSRSGSSYSEIRVDGPHIAITFDDGPTPKTTPRLLDILRAKGVKATFFVIGQNVSEYPDILRRTHAEGHEIANHTWSHPNLSKLANSGVRSQLERTQAAIKEVIGVAPTLMRPPYGAITKSQKQWIPDDLGLKVIMWSVDPLDWKYRSPSRVESEILKGTRAGSIVLAHDIHSTTVDAMSSTIDGLLAKGFKFVTVSELLAMERPPQAKPEPTPQAEAAAQPAGTPAPAPAASPAPAIPTGRAIPVEPAE